MKESDMHLFIGPVDFADPTLLISGDEQSLLWLADQIESRHGFVIANFGVAVIPVESGGKLDEEGGEYEWRIGKEQAKESAERLRALAKAPQPGHAYLDTDSPRQIVASKGEYDLKQLTAERK